MEVKGLEKLKKLFLKRFLMHFLTQFILGIEKITLTRT